MTQVMLRQGDVLLTRIARLPKKCTTISPSGEQVVLAYGENTGHAHTVDARAAQASLDEGGVLYLTVEELTAVRHQEHAPLTLEPGIYKVTRQRVYQPGAIRNVAD